MTNVMTSYFSYLVCIVFKQSQGDWLPSSWTTEEQHSDVSTVTYQETVPKRKRCRRSKKKSKWFVSELTPEEQQQYIAMDCEMVGVGPDGCQSALARVTLLDWHGQVLLDTLVQPRQQVTDFRTFVSGITAEDLLIQENVVDFESCRSLVLSYIENKVVIGHALKNDFQALQIYNHPWYLQRDTAKYEPFLQKDLDLFIPTDHCYTSRKNARKLKDLVYENLHRIIQPIGSTHDPIEDALGALDLYKLVRVKWEKSMAYKIARTKQIMQEQQHPTN